MQTRLAACLMLVCLAGAPAAFAADTVLTAGGALYAVGSSESENRLYLVKRIGEEKTLIAVPGTSDHRREESVELEYDGATDSLLVAWVRGSDILLSSLSAAGEWSVPLIISASADGPTIGELRLAVTHAKVEENRSATLVHASWWQHSSDFAAKYALIAFENAQHVSTAVGDLQELADFSSVVAQSTETEPVEEMGAALYPPLAMVPQGDGVEVVFGSQHNTALTHVILKPQPQARAWRPGKAGGSRVPRARLVSSTSAAIQALIGPEGIILYTREDQFRFVVFMNGEWSPVRTIALDERLTREHILDGLRRLGGR